MLPVLCTNTSYKRTLELNTHFLDTVYLVNQLVIFVQKHFHMDIVSSINRFYIFFNLIRN